MFFINGIWKKNSDPKNRVRIFEKVLHDKQIGAKNILQGKMIQLEKEYSVFMFKHDSLFFWSDNTIPIPSDFFNITASKEPVVIRLKNGWYMAQGKRAGNYSMFVLVLIKQQYPFENDYLKNRFPECYGIPPEVEIDLNRIGTPVYFHDGRYALSLFFPPKNHVNSGFTALLLTLFLLGFLFLIAFLFKFHETLSSRSPWRYLVIVGVATDVLFLRGLQFYFKFPSFLYQSDLFTPAIYSSSLLLPSLGDLLINAILFLALSYIFFLTWPKQQPALSNFRNKLIKLFTTFFLALFCFVGILFYIHGFIINSIIPFNLQNISSLAPYSGYGIFIIWSIWTCYFLIFWKPISNAFHNFNPKIRAEINLRISILVVVFFSFVSMVVINYSNYYKEKETRKILAIKLATKRNPITEALFSQLEKRILADSIIFRMAGESSLKMDSLSQPLEEYLKKAYFNDYWSKFNIQITQCSDSKRLQVQPQGYLISCQDYFKNVIQDFGENTSCSNLYFLDYGYGRENYLAVIGLPSKQKKEKNNQINLYIELNSKYVFKDVGYPELLIDRRLIEIPDISEYSYAFYQHGYIQYSAGKFQYYHNLQQYRPYFNDRPFFNFSGANHYFSRLSESGVLLISKKQQNFLTTLSPFAYLFLFFGFSSLFMYVILRHSFSNTVSLKTLRDRLQISIIGMLFLSFLALGLVIVVYIVRLNNEKNDDYLRERALSVQMELQYKFGSTDNGFRENVTILENQLIKMSNIFFADINIYDPKGRLLASSRPQVFDEGLISDRIDTYAFRQLKLGGQSLYIHDENIGEHNYSSAYMPFYNNENELLGYINLPYFTRQDDLRKEISTFLVAFINIYVLLFILGVLIAFLVAKYITLPLRLLAVKMGDFKLGKPNERIDWKRKDEIGQLVEQYNKMIEELGESAQKIAVSEREGAWREMARQVAHEIKNPLTPMKLSVQHLKRAWTDKATGWDTRLDRFTQTITEQIDALAVIASEFSDFAKMPVPQNEKLDLEEVLQAVIYLYKDFIQIDEDNRLKEKQAFVWADRKQLLRVFTNLFNNAVEAITNTKEGRIEVSLEEENCHFIVKIRDNGSGIPMDKSDYIFQPNFTTKSGGMGLGLAIVKAILQGMNGSIRVESDPGKGATFFLEIPSFKEGNNNNN